jgi:quaternary ammonium compound-resistance protein SugE
MAWATLILAGLLEVVWLVALRYSEGFARPASGILSVVIAWLSFSLLALALRTIPAGTAYAVWTGVGAAGAAVAGILLFGESRDAIRLMFIGLIIAGVVGVKVTH